MTSYLHFGFPVISPSILPKEQSESQDCVPCAWPAHAPVSHPHLAPPTFGHGKLKVTF